MDNAPIKENKMGTMPIGKLVFNMSLPMMISMLVQALYNIVDSIFVAMINEEALTAVSLAFPLQTLIISVATGTGVGINALLSRALGEKDSKKANEIALNGILCYIFSSVAFLILGFTIVKPFYIGQLGDTSSPIFQYGVDYLSIVMTCSFGIMGLILFDRLLTSTGRTFFSMLTQLSGTIVNIVLDPILIFGLLGAPKLGVKGAAIATVLGQCTSAVVGFILNKKVNKEVTLTFKNFKPSIKTVGRIYSIGLPSILMQSIGSVMTYLMNLILIEFTSTATAVFGVYFKLQSFFFMPLFGLNNGITPIIAYNYGAKNKKRMMKTLKVSLFVALGIMSLAFASFEIIPQLLLKLFNASDNMLEIGVPALRIIAIHYLIAWACIILGTLFQAVGRAVYSLIVSVMRQLVVLIPAAFILSRIGGLDLVWYSFPIAEIMSLAVSLLLFRRVYRKVIKPLDTN